METYISKLAPKTLLRMIKHVGQQGIPRNVQQAFNVLRRHSLKPFPPPEIKERKIPKLIVTGFTSEISNGVPLRGLLMRPNILSHIPSSCRAFRECNIKSVPCFTYGDTMGYSFLNTTKVGRDEDQQYSCICAEPFWSKYAVCIKYG